MWELGIQVGYEKDEKKLREKLEKLVKLGYRFVFLSLFNAEEKRLATDEELEKYSKIVKEYLIPYTTHALFLTDEPDKQPNSIFPYQKEILYKANILGVKCITYHFGLCKGIREGEDFAFEKCLNRYNVSVEDFRKLNIYVLKEICKIAKEYNLTITIENLPSSCLCDLGTTVSDLLKIIKEVNEDNLGICFDSGHANISGLDFYEEICKAGKYLKETHFHDNIGKISNKNEINDMHQPTGIGNINWIKVISAFKKIEYKNPVIFEISSDFETAEINITNWKRFLEIWEARFSNFKWSKDEREDMVVGT
ncbi:sugar phosphate isomerase/epimerase [bacterium]|nr:sugar phosphate isomerase/epimerase [bacterium]